MSRDPIRDLWERLRDWIYTERNYRWAYALGMGVIVYTVAFPDLLWMVGLWGLSLLLGLAYEPCLDPGSQTYGMKALVEGRQGVALTFDDGPSAPVTARLLDLLKALDVRATFFLIGEHATRHPELVRRMVEEGHLVGNHTQTHRNLLLLGPAETRAELESGSRSIASAAGAAPRYFRPPYGFRYPWTLRAARALGQEPVLWSVNPCDFHDPGADAIVTRVLREVKPGSIVLLHDGPRDREQTLEAVARLIPQLRERGLEPRRLDEI